MTDLPAPAASRAVLVGVSEYATQPRLPSVANNVRELRRLLTDTDWWGLPDEHCTTLVDPESTEQVLDAVHTAAAGASDALVFYFAGHGLLDDRGDLHLAMPAADKDRLYRAVRYDDVRREVVGATHVFSKVVILDCCFSGRAMQGGMSGSDDLADRARVEGTYLMTASAETKPALAPLGERYTAFTGALLGRMREGIPDGPTVLDMETLFHHVRADLQAKHQPVPQQRTRNDGRAIALVRNRCVTHAPREPVPLPAERPQPPAGFEDMRRWPPSKLLARVDSLRSAGSATEADQLLGASAAWRADQEVAAIADLLGRRGRVADLRTVRTAAVTRSHAQVLRIVDALRDTNQGPEAAELLRAAGATDAANVALLARRLRDQRRDDDLVLLLDAALTTAQEQSSITRLVNELWGAGIRQEVDELVNRAMSTLPGAAVAELADELRASGREEIAFRLYLVAADTLAATRPAVAVTQICDALNRTSGKVDAGRIATALVDTVDGPDRAIEVAQAFWKVKRPDDAMRALVQGAAGMSDTDVLALAAELRAMNRDHAAYDLCLRTAIERPGSTITIVTALREAGRPVDAKKLLEAAAEHIPIPTVPAVAQPADVEGAGQLGVLALAAELRATHRDDAAYDLCLRTAIERPEWTVGIVAVLRKENRPADAGRLLKAVAQQAPVPAVANLVRDCEDRDQEAVLTNAIRREPVDVTVLLDALLSTAPVLAERLTGLMMDAMRAQAGFVPVLLERCDRRRRSAILSWTTDTAEGRHAVGRLREDELRIYLDAAFSAVAASPHPDLLIATHVTSLCDAGRPHAVADLLTKAMEDRDLKAAKALISAIRETHHRGALDAVAGWVRATSAGEPNARYTLLRLGLREYAERR